MTNIIAGLDEFYRAEIGLVSAFWTVEVGEIIIVISLTNVAQLF